MQPLSPNRVSSSSSSQSQVAPIEGLAKGVIIHLILPYLFKRDKNEPNDSYDSYLHSKNRRAIFVASRLFSELESHVLSMRPDYLGEVLRESHLLKTGEEMYPYFDSLFTKKVTVLSSAFSPFQQRQQTAIREIESRFLFTAIEIKDVRVSKLHITRIINQRWFPNLQQITLNRCVLTPHVVKTLATMEKLTHLVLKNCKPYRSSRKDPQVYVNAIAKMSSLILLRIEGGKNFLGAYRDNSSVREGDLQPWKMPKLQRLQLVGQDIEQNNRIIDPMILASVATGSKLDELNLERSSPRMLEGITMAHLRRLNLNEPHSQNRLGFDTQTYIIPFILRHPLLEEVLLRSSKEHWSEYYIITGELMQALIACKQLKKLDLGNCRISYVALQMLADANLPLEELNLNIRTINNLPEGKTWQDALLLVAQMRSLTKLEIKTDNRDGASVQEQEAVVQALAASLPALESFTFHNATLTTTIVKLLQQFSRLQEVYFSAPSYIQAIYLLELIREGSYYSKNKLSLPQNMEEIIGQLASTTHLDLSILDTVTKSAINETILNKALRVRPFLTRLNAWYVPEFTDQVIRQMSPDMPLVEASLAGTSVTVKGVEELLRKYPQLTVFAPPRLNEKEGIALLQRLGEQNSLHTLDLWDMCLTEDCLELESITQMSALKTLLIRLPHTASPEQLSHILNRLAEGLPNLEELYVNGALFSMDVARQLCFFENLRSFRIENYDVNGYLLTEFLRPYWETTRCFNKEAAIFTFDEATSSMINQFREGSILDVSFLPEAVVQVLDDELIIVAISNRSQLTSIVLTNVSGFTDAGIEALETLEQVTEIDLSGTSVTFQGIQKLVEKCPHLTNITLSYTPDFDKIMQSIEGAKKLRSLHIVTGHNSVQVQPQHMQQVIKSLPQLTVLGFYGLDLTQKGVIAAISCSSRLETLFLNESALSDETGRELLHIPHTALSDTLRVIDCTDTQFPAEADEIPVSVYHNALKPHYLLQEIAVNQRNFIQIFHELLPRCHIIMPLPQQSEESENGQGSSSEFLI